MPVYISLMKLTEQGIKDIKNFPKRLETSVAYLEQLGAKLLDFFLKPREDPVLQGGDESWGLKPLLEI